VSLLLVSARVTEEYLARVAENMHLVVTIEMWEKSIVRKAPWYTSLPAWVHENVHGVRVLLCLDHYERWVTDRFPQTFTVDGQCTHLSHFVCHSGLY